MRSRRRHRRVGPAGRRTGLKKVRRKRNRHAQWKRRTGFSRNRLWGVKKHRKRNLVLFNIIPNNKIQAMENIPPPPGPPPSYSSAFGFNAPYGAVPEKFEYSPPGEYMYSYPPQFPHPPPFIETNLPSSVTCPQCHQAVVTEPVAKVGSLAWASCLVLIMLGFCCGCCLIPFCFDDFKDIYHVCPNCRNTIDVFKKT